MEAQYKSINLDLPDQKTREHHICFSPDGRFLAVSCETGECLLVDVYLGQVIQRLQAHEGWCRVSLFSPDQKHLFTGGDDGKVKAWRLSTGELAHVFDAFVHLNSHNNTVYGFPVLTLEVTSDLQWLLCSGHEWAIKLLPLADIGSKASVQDTPSINFHDYNWVTTIHLVKNDRLLVVGRGNGQIQLLNFPKGQLLKTVASQEIATGVFTTCYLKAEETVIATGPDAHIWQWGFDWFGQFVLKGRVPSPFSISGTNEDDSGTFICWSLDFSRSGGVMAMGTEGGMLGVVRRTASRWDIQSFASDKWEVYQSAENPRIRSVAFSPTEEYLLASAGYDGLVTLWDLSPHQQTFTMLEQRRRELTPQATSWNELAVLFERLSTKNSDTRADSLYREAERLSRSTIRTIQELDQYWIQSCNLTEKGGKLPHQAAMAPELESMFVEFNRALRVLDNGDATMAAYILHAITLSHPDFVAARNGLAEALHKMGRIQEAQQILEECLQINQHLDYIWYGLGSTCLDLGDPERAVVCLEKAVALNPGYVYAQRELGYAYLQVKRFDEAEAASKRVLSLFKEWTGRSADDYSIHQGKLLNGQIDWQDNLKVSYANLGFACYYRSKWEEAKSYFEKSAAIAPSTEVLEFLERTINCLHEKHLRLDSSFELGQIFVSDQAWVTLEQVGTSFADLVARHGQKDWGIVDREIVELNNKALNGGGTIKSIYKLRAGEWIWIQTVDMPRRTIVSLPEHVEIEHGGVHLSPIFARKSRR